MHFVKYNHVFIKKMICNQKKTTTQDHTKQHKCTVPNNCYHSPCTDEAVQLISSCKRNSSNHALTTHIIYT